MEYLFIFCTNTGVIIFLKIRNSNCIIVWTCFYVSNIFPLINFHFKITSCF